MNTNMSIVVSSNSILMRKHADWFLLVLIFLFFGYPIFSFISIFLGIESSAISIVCRALQVLSVILYTLFLLNRKLFRINHPMIFIFIMFWILYSVRIIYDTTAYEWKLGLLIYQYYLFGIVMGFLMSIPLFVNAPIDDRKFEQYSFWILLLLNILSLGYSLQQDMIFVSRLGGNEKLNPISSSFLAVWLICLCLKNWILGSAKDNNFRLFYIPAIIISIANMLIASTKMTFLILVIFICGLIYWIFKERKFGVLFLIFLFIVALVLVAIQTGLLDLFELIFYRFEDITGDQSSQERIMLLEGAFRQFIDNPLQGSFLEEYQLKMYPHNTVLEAFMATGVIGGFLYFIFFSGFLILSVPFFFKSKFSLLSQIAFGHVFIALLSGTLSFGIETWQIMVIVYASSSKTKLVAS